MPLSQRQTALRTERERHTDAVDPRPVEEAVLEPRADSMRDMVQRHLAEQRRAAFEADMPDEDFLDDDEVELAELVEHAPLSDYQLHELAIEMERRTAPLGDSSEAAGGGSETGAEGADDSERSEDSGSEAPDP